MECLLEKYNTHKRRTLDRLTAVYANQGISIIRRIYEAELNTIIKCLDSDKSYEPDLKGFDKRFEDLLEGHFEHVIKAGVSDGYREVTPENKLSTWLDYNLLLPVEQTIPVNLTKFRDTLADKIEKTIGDRKPKAFLDLIGFTKDQQRNYLKTVFRDVAKDWLKGESTVEDVKKKLSDTLQKSASSVERVFRTETTKWFNESRVEYFQSQTSATHVQIFAVTDGRTSHICESRNGYVVPMDKAHLKKYLPPFHPNCRTVQRALFESIPSHKRLIDIGMAMDERKFELLPHGWAA